MIYLDENNISISKIMYTLLFCMDFFSIYISFRLCWLIALFRSPTSLLIIRFAKHGGVLKSLNIIEHLSLSPFSFISLCFMYLESQSFSVHTFRAIISSWLVDYFIIAFVSNKFLSLKSTLSSINIAICVCLVNVCISFYFQFELIFSYFTQSGKFWIWVSCL